MGSSPSIWTHLAGVFSEGVFRKGIFIALEWWVSGNVILGSILFSPKTSRHYTSLPRTFTMTDEKSIIALWLSLCRESLRQDSIEDCVPPVSHGCTGNIYNGLVFFSVQSGFMSFSNLGKCAFSTTHPTAHSAIPSTLTLEHLILSSLSCFSTLCFILSPRPDSHWWLL